MNDAQRKAAAYRRLDAFLGTGGVTDALDNLRESLTHLHECTGRMCTCGDYHDESEVASNVCPLTEPCKWCDEIKGGGKFQRPMLDLLAEVEGHVYREQVSA